MLASTMEGRRCIYLLCGSNSTTSLRALHISRALRELLASDHVTTKSLAYAADLRFFSTTCTSRNSDMQRPRIQRAFLAVDFVNLVQTLATACNVALGHEINIQRI